jgi:hypothetical protein
MGPLVWRETPVLEALCFKQKTGGWIMSKNTTNVLIYHCKKIADFINIVAAKLLSNRLRLDTIKVN